MGFFAAPTMGASKPVYVRLFCRYSDAEVTCRSFPASKIRLRLRSVTERHLRAGQVAADGVQYLCSLHAAMPPRCLAISKNCMALHSLLQHFEQRLNSHFLQPIKMLSR